MRGSHQCWNRKGDGRVNGQGDADEEEGDAGMHDTMAKKERDRNRSGTVVVSWGGANEMVSSIGFLRAFYTDGWGGLD